MKKIFILLVIACMNQAQAQAQKKFGVFFGVNNPVLTEGIMEGFDGYFKLTPHVGVFYEMKITEKIHFRPKLVYSAEGNWDQPNRSYSTYQTAYRGHHLNYINIPMDFKFWNKVYVVFGPQVGFLVKEQKENPFQEDAKSSIDFGLNLAFGTRFKNVFFELGTYQGFAPVAEYTYFGKTKLYNANAKFSVGWYIL